MGLKEKLSNRYAQTYMKKYGDRLTQVYGKVISVKVEEKKILWIFNKLTVSIIVKPDGSSAISKCYYKKNRWFKKPEFIPISKGHTVLIQGLKGKKGKENREQVQVLNVRNMTTKKDLVPIEGKVPQVKRIQRMR